MFLLEKQHMNTVFYPANMPPWARVTALWADPHSSEEFPFGCPKEQNYSGPHKDWTPWGHMGFLWATHSGFTYSRCMQGPRKCGFSLPHSSPTDATSVPTQACLLFSPVQESFCQFIPAFSFIFNACMRANNLLFSGSDRRKISTIILF